MNKKILMLIVSCAVLALFLSIVFLYDRIFEKNLQEQLATTQGFELPTTTQPPPTTIPGDDAPTFTLTNAAGEAITLESLHGKPVVMTFWASWNTDSVAGLSYLEDLHKSHGDRLHVLMINVTDGTKETRETADAFLAEKNFSCPVYFDDGTVAAAYKTENLPMTFFLNAEGVAKAYISGAIDQDAMDRGLAIILEN